MSSTPVAPTPVKTSAAGESTAAQRKNRIQEDAAGGSTTAAGFSILLQAAGAQEEDSATQALAALAMAQSDAEAVPETGGQAGGVLSQDALAQEAAWTADLAWNVQSLVGQTAQLDQAAEAAVRDGTHVQAGRDAGLRNGLVGAANAAAMAAAQVPVAEQGVVGTGTAAAGMAATGFSGDTAAASGAETQASDTVAETLAVDASEPADTVQRGERSSEGRMALQGQWTAADLQAKPAEVMQRLLGQMSQFLVSQGGEGLGGLRRAVGKTDEGSTVTGAETAAVYGGSGTGRLSENAVSQAAASQQMQNSEPQAEPDMAFWMNARQQRAEMVLDRDGEPVRVQVTMQGNEAHVTFLSDAPGTRSMLDASMAQLRDMLAAQGVELAGAQVRTQADGEAQSDGSGREDRFMPEGARRMRVQAAAIPGLDAGMLTGAGRAPHQGLDVFA